MSLLLKALEKSEASQAGGSGENTPTSSLSAGLKQPAVATAPVEASAGGEGIKLDAAPSMSLGGGSKLGAATAKNKLGSALENKAESSEDAARVVAAYEADSTDNQDLIQASKRTRIRNFSILAVVVVVVGGGYYGAKEFGIMDLVKTEDAKSAESEIETETQTTVAVEIQRLLPLSEPIFDIQENILIASLDSDIVGDQQVDNIANQVTNVVASIIGEQLESDRRQQLLAEGNVESETLGISDEEKLEKLFRGEFDAASADSKTNLDKVTLLAQLDALVAPKIIDNGKQYIKVDGIADLTEASLGSGNEIVAEVAPTEVVLVKNDSGFKELLARGVSAYSVGNLNDAEDAFRTIVAAEPHNVPALIGLAKVHQSRGNSRLAISTYLKASDYAPENPDIIGELLALQSSGNDLELSEKKLLTMLSRASDKKVQAKILFGLANIFARKKQWLQAKNSLTEAISLNDKNPDYAYNLAVVSDYLQASDEALDMYKRAFLLAKTTPSSFSSEEVSDRIAELEK